MAEGVQQAYEIQTVGISDYPQIVLNAKVFPNSTENQFQLQLNGFEIPQGGMTARLYDGVAQILNKPNLAPVATSGNYNDLTNRPTIPAVPTDVSAFNNDAGYITAADIPAATEQVNADWNATSGAAQILNKPNLTTVATTGNYNDLTNKPDLANVVQVWDLVEMEEYLTGVINQKCNKLQNKIDSLANIIGQRPLVVINTIFYGDRNSTLVKTRITNDFGEPILYEGVCYGTSPNPTITNSAVVTQPLFVSNDGYNYKSYYINNLTAGRTYYIRAFATSPHGTTYYGSSTFVPSYYAVPPTGSKTVTFPSGQNTMEVYDYGGPFNYDNNFNGSLTINPGVAGKRVKINAIELTTEQNYDSLLIYVGGVLQFKFYANYNNSNFNVIGSGADKSVTLKFKSDNSKVKSGFKGTLSLVDDPYPCAGISNVKDVENNTYGIVAIGNQCWMKENLRTKKFADGTSITHHSPGVYVSNEDRENNAFCCYVSKASSASTYGLLYNWRAVMKNNSSGSASNPSGLQGICPTGWHVPSLAEFEQMINNVKSVSTNRCNNNSNYIAKSLAATTLWQTSTTSCAPGNEPLTNNMTGFLAYPAGRWTQTAVYTPYSSNPNVDLGKLAEFWTSTKSSSSNLQFEVFYISYNTTGITYTTSETRENYPVRCVRN